MRKEDLIENPIALQRALKQVKENYNKYNHAIPSRIIVGDLLYTLQDQGNGIVHVVDLELSKEITY